MKFILNFLDRILMSCARKGTVPFARFALFVVYFWFGILKVVGESPANPLVSDLLGKTMPFMTFDTFIVLFGLFEVLIGILFLFPRFTKFSIFLLCIHMITTVMPLFVLTGVTWSKPFVPTLEGQYIIKNLLIIATALTIVSHMHLPQKRED